MLMLSIRDICIIIRDIINKCVIIIDPRFTNSYNIKFIFIYIYIYIYISIYIYKCEMVYEETYAIIPII